MKPETAIRIQIRTLNNTLRRNVESRSVTAELTQMTGTNAWMIAFIAERTDQGLDVFQRDIENTFSVTRSTVSKVIQLMEKKGMLRREPVDYDARLKKLVLCGPALELSRMLREDTFQLERELTAGFSAEELTLLSDFLNRLQRNAEIQPIKEENT